MTHGSVARIPLWIAVCLALANSAARGQGIPPPPASSLTESGHTTVDGRPAPYTIHRLPPNAFPDLPEPIVDQLDHRGCLIPQTYEAHHPENLVHASLEHAGSSDWAVLCASKGAVSLLVFFSSAPDHPIVLATALETDRLQPHDAGTLLGFNWGIDRASPQQVHDMRIGMDPRPPRLDHDALADSILDNHTLFHFYAKGNWTLLDMPE
ncbi:MAG: hypothetical protein WCC26_16970 [Terracidiphilus sp.]